MKEHEAEMDFVQRSPIPFDGQNLHAICVNYFPLTIITLTTMHDRYTTKDYSQQTPGGIYAELVQSRNRKTEYIKLLFYAFLLRLFALTPLANLHYVIYALSLSVERPLAGCLLSR